MPVYRSRVTGLAACLVLLGSLAACAPTAPPKKVQPVVAPPTCTPAAAGDALVGNWLSVATQKGVAGSVRTLYTLNPDGTMSYVEQVKRPRTPSQGLYENGCWSREGQTLVLRTLQSNGSTVSLDDPIYTNRYRIEHIDAMEVRMQGPNGSIKARRMSPGYRLPF